MVSVAQPLGTAPAALVLIRLGSVSLLRIVW